MTVKEFVYNYKNKIMLIHKILSSIFSPNIINLFEIVDEHECSHQDVSQAIYNIRVGSSLYIRTTRPLISVVNST